MKTFKGTKKMYAVEYAGFISLNDEPFYEGKNCLDFGDVGENVAKANAKIASASTEMLKALEIIMTISNDHAVIRIANAAIKEAIG